MKKLLLVLAFLPLASIAQIQIGQTVVGENDEEFFGSSMSFSNDGNRFIVGAPGNSTVAPFSGAARVFELENDTWVQVGQTLNGDNDLDTLGAVVSISSDGSIVSIGSERPDEFRGLTRVFEEQGGTWVQIGQDLVGEFENDDLGGFSTLSDDGTTIALGAEFAGISTVAGFTRIFRNVNDTWVQLGQTLQGNVGDQSGRAISLSEDGNIVAIGSRTNSDNGFRTGTVRIFENQNDTWVQIGQNIDGQIDQIGLGTSVSITSDGTTVAMGGWPGISGNPSPGIVSVFTNQGGSWIQVGTNIVGPTPGDRFGDSVSISDNGNVVSVGSNSDNTARTYQNVNGTWQQIGQDIPVSGTLVGLSGDGLTLATATAETEFGAVAVFDITQVLSINEASVSNFKVLPNPATTTIELQLNGNTVLNTVRIYDITGRVVKVATHPIINIEDIAQGNYIVEVNTNQGRSTQKLIVR